MVYSFLRTRTSTYGWSLQEERVWVSMGLSKHWSSLNYEMICLIKQWVWKYAKCLPGNLVECCKTNFFIKLVILFNSKRSCPTSRFGAFTAFLLEKKAAIFFWIRPWFSISGSWHRKIQNWGLHIHIDALWTDSPALAIWSSTRHQKTPELPFLTHKEEGWNRVTNSSKVHRDTWFGIQNFPDIIWPKVHSMYIM